MFEITGARLLAANGGLVSASLVFDDDGIRGIDIAAVSARRIDADGLLVLPGIVDLHGDAFERQLMPRPGVHFATAVALLETDRQMIANGITTAYHGLTWSWEPGLRGADAARGFVAALETQRQRLCCDTRLHLRHEAYNLDAEDEILDWLSRGRVDLLAFNDHIQPIAAAADNPKKWRNTPAVRA
jgi:alpha-D-ribose 1-methylphosphonate 5-triphosphate diphosphatase